MKPLLIPTAIIAGLVCTFPVQAEKVSFNKDVRPILNRKCTGCHGGVKRKGGFSFLYRAETTKPAKSGLAPIVVGKAADSEMIHRVLLEEDDDMMPPEGDRLTDKEIATLKQWINEGAEYAEHWAYLPAEKQDTPEVKNSSWARNHIDHFVLKRLESEGLAPSPEAKPSTLLRRLHLDLTGLPPSEADINRFMQDPSDKAYEAEVDRLLASPRFGERWAGMWLDLARYADTQGYEKDNARSISPFRDWVIKAFNRDDGFDRFTIEQLAGDLLPNPSEDQLVATGFHRNTMTNTEGGTDDEEFRVAAVVDRVNTTWDVWMGTSFGCVQCHNHPYDPFLHKEYYQFMDFLNQSEDTDRHNDAPFIHVPNTEERQKLEALEEELATRKAEESDIIKASIDAQREWETSAQEPTEWTESDIITTTSTHDGVTFTTLDDGSILAGGDNPANKNSYTVRLTSDLAQLGAIRLETLPHESLPHGSSGRDDEGMFILSKITVQLVTQAGTENETSSPLPIVHAEADAERKGFPVKDAWKTRRIKFNGWSVDAKSQHPHWAAFAFKEPVDIEDGSQIEITLEFGYRFGRNAIGRFNVSTHSDPSVVKEAKARLLARDIAAKAEESRSDKENDQIRQAFLSVHDPYITVTKEIERIEKEMESFKGTKTLVMKDLSKDKQRTTQVFNGGNWLAKGDSVSADTPGVMPPLGDRPNNRLGMAQWMVSRDNPLTARVTVNRFWDQIFGNGLVTTMADFGTQGEPPTHPGLLDDLAVRWMEDQNWSVKALLKSFVMSSTYRQSSNISRDMLERDPHNQLLARGPRYRLSAEQIRDQALAVSGLLSDKMYGKSVMPPQPKGIWQTVYNGADWKTADNEDRYRRGLYTYWKRTSPYPSMESFDVPSREFCVPRRIRTNTPLQALVTLNDPAFFEAAQALAEKMVEVGLKDPDAGISRGFKLVLARTPSEAELRRMKELFLDETKRFANNAEAAAKISGSKEAEPERAAWVIAANVLLNLDETLTRE